MLNRTLDENTPLTPIRPLWAIAAFITSGAFITSVLAQGLMLLLEHKTGAAAAKPLETPLSLVRGAMVVQLALAALVVVLLRRHTVLRHRMPEHQSLSLGPLILCLGLILGLAPLANDLGLHFARALHQPPDSSAWVSHIVRHANWWEFGTLALVLTVMPALVEEHLFRGVLLGALLGAPSWLAIGLQALAFGAFHVDPAQGVATFILGLGFGFMRLQTRTLTAAVVSHATYNAVVLGSMRVIHAPAADPSTSQSLAVLLGGAALSAICVLGLLRQKIDRPSRLEAS